MHPERLTLAERLFRMRKNAGLTGDQLAAELGWGATGRTKVSKIENGRQVPSPEEVQAWTLAAGHPEQAMLGQLDRLLSLGLDNVTLGIIPFGELQLIPFNSFLLLDDDLTVETWGGKDQETAGDEAALHHRIFDLLMAEALTGHEARRLIAAVAEELGTK